MYFSCALISDGTVKCWGQNGDGQVGTGDGIVYHREPITVYGIDNAVSVAVGASHACTALSNGSVKCWGSSVYNAVNDTLDDVIRPVGVSGISNAVEVISGSKATQTCAKSSTGRLECWGGNGYSKALGDGSQTSGSNGVYPPQEALSGRSNIVDYAPGGTHTCALLESGNVGCWGYGSQGRLGLGADFNPGPRLSLDECPAE